MTENPFAKHFQSEDNPFSQHFPERRGSIPESPTQPKEKPGDFSQGLKRGALQTSGNIARFGEGVATETGSNQGKEFLGELASAAGSRAQSYAPNIASYKDVNSFGSGIDYLQGLLAEQVPNMGLSLAGAAAGAKAGASLPLPPQFRAAAGVVGGAAGAFVPSLVLNTGEVYGEQRDNDYDNFRSALKTGAAMGALDAVVPGNVAGKFISEPVKGAFKQGIGQGLKETAKAAGKGFVKGAPLEAATEAGQEELAIRHRSSYDPSYDIYGDEANARRIESAIAGGLVGGSVSAAGDAVQTALPQGTIDLLKEGQKDNAVVKTKALELPILPQDEIITFNDGSQARRSELINHFTQQGYDENSANQFINGLIKTRDVEQGDATPDMKAYLDAEQAIMERRKGLLDIINKGQGVNQQIQQPPLANNNGGQNATRITQRESTDIDGTERANTPGIKQTGIRESGNQDEVANARGAIGVQGKGISKQSFKPTHVTVDGENVAETAETGIYVNEKGEEIEDSYATPISHEGDKRQAALRVQTKEVKARDNTAQQKGQNELNPLSYPAKGNLNNDQETTQSGKNSLPVGQKQALGSTDGEPNGPDSVQPVTRDPILTQSQGVYVAKRLKEQGVKKTSPGFERAKANVIKQYRQERERAEVSLPFDEFKTLKANKGVPEGLVKQSYDTARDELGITDTSQSASIRNQGIDTNEKTQSVQPNKGADNSADAMVNADSATAQGVSAGTEKSNEQAEKLNKVSKTSKSVRDNPQQAVISNGKITIVNRSGRKTVLKKSFDLSKWESLENSFGNPDFNKREFIKKLNTVVVDDSVESDSLKQRIIDSQISAINSAYKSLNESQPIQQTAKSNDAPVVQNDGEVSQQAKPQSKQDAGGNDSVSQQGALDEPKAKNQQVQVPSNSQSPNPQQDAAADETKDGNKKPSSATKDEDGGVEVKGPEKTDKGTALFSKSTKTTGSTTAQVKSWLPRRAQKMLGNGLEVVQSVSDIEKLLRPISKSESSGVQNSSNLLGSNEVALGDVSAGQSIIEFIDNINSNSALGNVGVPNTTSSSKGKIDGGIVHISKSGRNLLISKPLVKEINSLFDGVPVVDFGGMKFMGKEIPFKRALGDIKFLSDLNKTHAFRMKGFSAFDIPSNRMVLGKMFRVASDLKITDDIIKLIPVDVVDMLARKKLTPKMLFHNKSVFIDSLSVDANDFIATSINKAFISALNRAKINTTTVDAASNSGQHSGASFAFDGDSNGSVNSSALFGAKVGGSFTKGSSGKGGVTGGTIDDRHSVTPESNVMLDGEVVDATSSSPIISNNIQGAYHNGTIYLVADNLDKSNVQSVISHELMHHAIATNPKLKETLLNSKSQFSEIVSKLESGEYRGRYKSIYDEALRRTKDADTPSSDITEEFIAYSLEIFNTNPASIPARLKRLIQKLISQIRMTLMRVGVPVGKLTPADLNALAMQAMKSGSTNSAGENVVALASKQGYKGTDKGEAEEWLRAKAKGLDMSLEARMNRAKDMGFFTKYDILNDLAGQFDPENEELFSDDPFIWYHGTNSKLNLNGFKQAIGKNNYNPNNINGGYAFFTSNKSEARSYGDNVYEFLIKPSFDGEYYGDTYKSENPDVLPNFENLKKKGYSQTFVELRNRKNLKVNGYWMLPYEASQIRSINAAFDPDYADSGNLLASASKQGYKGTDKGEAEEWLRAKAKGLDMSKEARMERAKAMGFDVDTVWYHGTDANINEFNPGMNKMSDYEKGVYFTDNPKIATAYARRNRKTSDNEGVIYPVYLHKPKTTINKIKSKDKLSPTLNRDERGNIVVVKNANQIRSIHAAFDPDYADSGNLLASVSDKQATEDSGVKFSKAKKGGNSAWRNQPGFEDLTDEQFETLGKIGQPPNAPLTEKVKEQFNKHKYLWREKLKQGIFDQYDSFKSILNDKRAWMMANISNTGGAVVESAIEFGRPFLDSSGAIDSNTELKSLGQIFEPLGDEVDRFMMWIAGNRALRLSQEDRERLFSDADINNLIDMSKGKAKDGKSRESLYQKVRTDFEAMNNAFVKIGVDTGLVSQADAKIWKDQGFYVPFYRLADDMESTQGPSSVGGLVKQQAYKKLKGADMQLNDLLTNTMMNWNHLINASLKNQAATKALETAVSLGVAEEIQAKDKGKKSIFIRQDGKERWFNVDETQEGALILDSLNALNWNGLNNQAMKVMRKFKRALTVGVTASPEFKVANLLRDSIQAIAVSDMSTNIAKNLYEGFKYSAEGQATKARMIAGGGAFGDSGYIHGADPDAIKIVLRKGMDRASILDGRNIVKTLWDRYQDFGARLENVNRMANFERALEQGKDLLTANFEARDQLDFQRTGSFVSVRAMAQIIPFLNARLQGLNKLGRAMNDPNQRKQFSAVVGVYSALSIMLYLAMKDDDDYKEAEQWERDTYHLFKLPGSDTMLRMPRPFEVGAIANMLERGVEQMVDDEVHGELFAERLKHAITQTLSIDIVPQAIKPINEVWANKSSFTGRDIESQAMQRLSPTERKKVWTSQTAIGLSKTMDAILWDDVVLSPIQVEHLVNGYLGWAGATVLSGIDMIARPLVGAPELPEKTLHDMPVIGRFVRDKNPRNSRFITEFYEKQKELQTVFNDIKQYRENQEFEKASDKLDEYKDQLRFRKSINRAQRRLSDLNKRIRLITKSDASPEQKRKRIDEINAMRIDVARKAVSRLPN